MSAEMEHQGTNHTERRMLFILGGAVIGTAVGLLTAPQSGLRTRRQIVRKVEEVKDQAIDLYNNVTDAVEDLRRGVTRKIDAGKEYVDKKTEKFRARPSGLKNPLSGLIKKFRG